MMEKKPKLRSVSITLMLFFFLMFTHILSPFQSTHVTGQTMDQFKESPSLHYSVNEIVSTRGHFDYNEAGELGSGHNSTEYLHYNDNTSNMSDHLQNDILCPSQKEIVIYIHGPWVDKASAIEEFNRTSMSLVANNYTIPLIGFSWDSNTHFSKEGWETAKRIAENNGPKLAEFISDFKSKCRDTDIRLIAHSLGAAVVNSTLASLSSSQEVENNDKFNITSVHLLGAAMDRMATASNTSFGKAIDRMVDEFYNLRDSEDNMLEYVYKHLENTDALGLLGIAHSLPLPGDYIEREVNSEIPPIPDADANNKLDCFDFFVLLPGDNHCGYIGFRSLPPFDNVLRDDGSIDIVAQDWVEQE